MVVMKNEIVSNHHLFLKHIPFAYVEIFAADLLRIDMQQGQGVSGIRFLKDLFKPVKINELSRKLRPK